MCSNLHHPSDTLCVLNLSIARAQSMSMNVKVNLQHTWDLRNTDIWPLYRPKVSTSLVLPRIWPNAIAFGTKSWIVTEKRTRVFIVPSTARSCIIELRLHTASRLDVVSNVSPVISPGLASWAQWSSSNGIWHLVSIVVYFYDAHLLEIATLFPSSIWDGRFAFHKIIFHRDHPRV